MFAAEEIYFNPTLDEKTAIKKGKAKANVIKHLENIKSDDQTKNSGSVPEHILRNIKRVKQAALEREKRGHSLPKIKFVRGGAPGTGKRS